MPYSYWTICTSRVFYIRDKRNNYNRTFEKAFNGQLTALLILNAMINCSEQKIDNTKIKMSKETKDYENEQLANYITKHIKFIGRIKKLIAKFTKLKNFNMQTEEDKVPKPFILKKL